MPSQGDELMARKRQMRGADVRGFTFTTQVVEASPKDIEKPPNNWHEPAHAAGGYFRHTNPMARVPSMVAPKADSGHLDATHSHDRSITPRQRAQQKAASQSAGISGGDPADLQVKLEALAQERVTKALEKKEAEENERMVQRRLLREATRMKIQQRMKARVELQVASNQPPTEKTLKTLGMTKDDLPVRDPLDTSAKAQHRKDLSRTAHSTYLTFNESRMNQNLLHRAACHETLRQRRMDRECLEDMVGSHFHDKKKRLLMSVNIPPHEASTMKFPSVAEMTMRRTQTQSMFQQWREQEDYNETLHAEMTRLDDELWERRRAIRKGAGKSPRRRDLPFHTEAPVSHRNSATPLPNLFNKTM